MWDQDKTVTAKGTEDKEEQTETRRVEARSLIKYNFRDNKCVNHRRQSENM